jgi:hypothetical protein
MTPYNEGVLTKRLITVGPTLLLGAVATGLYLLFYGNFVSDISSLLFFAIPLLILIAVVGVLITMAGAVLWLLRAPVRRLLWSGVVLTAVGCALFFVVNRMQFGFDDPRVLFVVAMTFTPLLVGGLFIVSAGIRHLRMLMKAS